MCTLPFFSFFTILLLFHQSESTRIKESVGMFTFNEKFEDIYTELRLLPTGVVENRPLIPLSDDDLIKLLEKAKMQDKSKRVVINILVQNPAKTSSKDLLKMMSNLSRSCTKLKRSDFTFNFIYLSVD